MLVRNYLVLTAMTGALCVPPGKPEIKCKKAEKENKKKEKGYKKKEKQRKEEVVRDAIKE